MITLRPYQQEGVAAIRERFASGIKRVVFVMPTGSGKGPTFAHVAAGVANKGKRVAIITHRGELLDQISNALNEFGVPHGTLVRGSYGMSSARVMVASVQMLARRLTHFKAPDLLIIEECHHCVPDTNFGKVALHCKDSFHLGVTATPGRLDGRGLGDIFHSMVMGPSVAWLIDQGYLTPITVFAPPVAPDMVGVHRRAGDFKREEAAARLDKPKITGDALEHYLSLARGRRAVIRACSIEHSHHIVEQFKMGGVKAEHVDGKTDDGRRAKILKAFRDGEIEAVSNVDLFNEGVDVPGAEVAIDMRPTESLTLAMQFWGRVCRPVYAPGYDLSTRDGRLAAIANGPKPTAFLFDHANNTRGRHGLPDDERNWVLSPTEFGQSKSQAAPLRTCKKCLAVYRPAPVCPRCGAFWEAEGREVAHVAGELEKVTREEREDARKRAYLEVENAKEREELEKIRVARGYHERWTDYVLAARAKKKARPPIHSTSSQAQLFGDEPT